MHINNYLNIPWKDQDPSFQGCMCWGLVQLFYDNEFDIELPNLDELQGSLHLWREVPLDGTPLEYGDVLLFRMPGVRRHVGIVIEDPHMLHVERHLPSHIESFRSMRWKNRLMSAWRYIR